MDFPFKRHPRYDVSNNWWFLPADVNQMGKDQANANTNQKGYDSALLNYLRRISNPNKFKYMVIIIVMILFISRLNFSANLWIGLIIGFLVVYYFNERNEQERNDESDQILNILDSNLLKRTKYFIMDTRLIKWANEVGEFKQFNVIEFNNMIRTLDRIMRLIYHIEIGIEYCRETLQIIQDLKTEALNQFHSLVFRIPSGGLRRKFNFQLEELDHLLNDHINRISRVCRLYYMSKGINIDSDTRVLRLEDPKPDDPSFDPHFNFYN
jgi:hypothetical protein